MHRILSTVILAGVVGLSSVALDAHHAVGTVYRLDEQLTIEGVVVSLVYRSPHSFLHVKAPDQTKQMRVWAVECGSAEQFRRNVAEGMLKPGDDVIVTGDVGRDEGQWRLRLRSVVRPRDGWRWKEWVR
jgi:DNA/RNA endonuclease YhcR with UshA esterase domain